MTPPTIDEIDLTSKALLAKISEGEAAAERRAFLRAVVDALKPTRRRPTRLELVTQYAAVDRATKAALDAANDTLYDAIGQARAVGPTWDAIARAVDRPETSVINVFYEWIAGRHVEWDADADVQAVLQLLERAAEAHDAHDEARASARFKLMEQADLANASGLAWSLIAEAADMSYNAMVVAHRDWAIANPNVAKVQYRPLDDRRAATMDALRGWARENGGAMPTGLKRYNDVPVGRKLLAFRERWRKGKLDPEIERELAELFGSDWTEPAPPGSETWKERMLAGKEAGK